MAEVRLTMEEYLELHNRAKEAEGNLQLIKDKLLKPVIKADEVLEAKTHGGSVLMQLEMDLTDDSTWGLVKQWFATRLKELGIDHAPEKNDDPTVTVGRFYFPHPLNCVGCGKLLSKDNQMVDYCPRAFCKDCCLTCDRYDNGNCWYYTNALKRQQAAADEAARKAEEARAEAFEIVQQAGRDSEDPIV